MSKPAGGGRIAAPLFKAVKMGRNPSGAEGKSPTPTAWALRDREPIRLTSSVHSVCDAIPGAETMKYGIHHLHKVCRRQVAIEPSGKGLATRQLRRCRAKF